MNPIDVRDTYNNLFKQLLTILSKTPNEHFLNKTILKYWNVKDVIAHLAANSLQKTSAIKDFHHFNTLQNTRSNFEDLSRMISINNEKWVELYHPLNIQVLLNLFKFSYSSMLVEFDNIKNLDEPAVHNVFWAHSSLSPWWLDIAREYTELWIHSKHILDAISEFDITKNIYFMPFIETCFTALEKHYSPFKADFTLVIQIDRLSWIFTNLNGNCSLDFGASVRKQYSKVCLTKETAWKIFSGIEDDDIEVLSIEGDSQLCRHLLSMRCVMA